ncbi:MAG: hypothetical protein L0332_30490 [Chloroflexi bacterium]|nr:hypothetical protein [Chloroflexota bacterium]MCI0577276.1 hypothetical protein [Chloroflexota bacterium]MCI0649871.1 hypothetical protein [Chloroflexota bacterium]MCI0731029.1 hypothetical protein [Chloroflexota bacterium]
MNVKKVEIPELVQAGMRGNDAQLIPGGVNLEWTEAYFFGHTFTVQIEVDDIAHCRLYWAEKTNVPIIDQQNSNYFVDMYKLKGDQKLFQSWNKAKGEGARVATLTDIPAMFVPKNYLGDKYRWLDIVVLVHNTTDNSARKVHFRQDLLYWPNGDESQAKKRLVELDVTNLGNNYIQANTNHYVYQILANDEVVTDPAGELEQLFSGTPTSLY